MKKFYIIIISMLCSIMAFAQSNPREYDVVVLMFNEYGNDVIAWMPTIDLQPGTELKFTNRGYLSAGRFNSAYSSRQSVLTYTAPTTITAGSIMHFGRYSSYTGYGYSNSRFDITNYEQLSILTGNSGSNPYVLFVVDDDREGNYGSSSGSSFSTSCSRPSHLGDGDTAFSRTIDGEFFYDDDFTPADADTWITRITNESNWGTGSASSYNNYSDAITSTTIGESLPFVEPDISSTASGDWSNAATWVGDDIPYSANNVTITTGTVTVDQDLACNNLTINSGASLVISADKSLLVKGTITNSAGNSGLIIESTADGTGKILTTASGVAATVRQYITGGTVSSENNYWHYMSLPISGTPNVETIFAGAHVAKHVEADLTDSNSGWTYLQNGETLEVGRGYGIWAENSMTIEYTGTLNTGDVVVNLTYAGSGTLAGFNLVGNPYPTTLNWENMTRTSDVNQAIYVYNSAAGQYDSYVAGVGNSLTREIPPMQAFFVKVDAAGQSITFEDDAKATLNINFKSATISQILRLKVECNDRDDETILRGHADANEQFNGDLDAYKLLVADSKSPQIYSTIDDIKYSINSISQIGHDLIMPISILTNQNEVHKLSLGEMKELDYQHVYIRNLSNDQVADLYSTRRFEDLI